MKLLMSYTSPFARKIRMLAHLLNIEEKLELVIVDPFASTDTLTQANPLSKVPALLLDDGRSFVGSALITDYLTAHFDGEAILPSTGERRWDILQHAAIAEGIIDAAVTHVFESRRPEGKQQVEKLSRQYDVIRRALAALGRSTHPLSVTQPTAYELTLATALGYLVFRHAGQFNHDISPAIRAWYSEFHRHPCMTSTEPPT